MEDCKYECTIKCTQMILSVVKLTTVPEIDGNVKVNFAKTSKKIEREIFHLFKVDKKVECTLSEFFNRVIRRELFNSPIATARIDTNTMITTIITSIKDALTKSDVLAKQFKDIPGASNDGKKTLSVYQTISIPIKLKIKTVDVPVTIYIEQDFGIEVFSSSDLDVQDVTHEKHLLSSIPCIFTNDEKIISFCLFQMSIQKINFVKIFISTTDDVTENNINDLFTITFDNVIEINEIVSCKFLYNFDTDKNFYEVTFRYNIDHENAINFCVLKIKKEDSRVSVLSKMDATLMVKLFVSF